MCPVALAVCPCTEDHHAQLVVSRPSAFTPQRDEKFAISTPHTSQPDAGRSRRCRSTKYPVIPSMRVTEHDSKHRESACWPNGPYGDEFENVVPNGCNIVGHHEPAVVRCLQLGRMLIFFSGLLKRARHPTGRWHDPDKRCNLTCVRELAASRRKACMRGDVSAAVTPGYSS